MEFETTTTGDDGTYDRAYRASKGIPTSTLRMILRTGITENPASIRAIEAVLAEREAGECTCWATSPNACPKHFIQED